MTRSGLLSTSPFGRVVDHGDDIFVIGADGTAHQLTGDSAELVRAILAFAGAPRTRDQILAHLEALVGAPIESPQTIDEALALLQSAGALAPPPPSLPATTTTAATRLVLGISGAVAASGAPDLITRLLRSGFEVRVAMTRDARRFVSPLVLEATTQHAVYRSLWQSTVPHIQLAEWAQLVLVCPASATTISRIAAGDCSDLVAAIAVGTRAPRLIVPSMNAAMYQSPMVQRNLSRLRDDGCWLAHAGQGEELAHAPAHRAPIAGAMPAHAAVVDLARFVATSR